MRPQGLHPISEESVHLPSESTLLAGQPNTQHGINTQHLNPFVISFRPDSESKQSELAIKVEQFPNKRVSKNSRPPFIATTCKQQTKRSKQFLEQYSNLTEKFRFGRMEKECIGLFHLEHNEVRSIENVVLCSVRSVH